MNQVTDHSSFKVDAFKGFWPKVHDSRIELIEAVVCEHYSENKASLKDWKSNSEARYMNAFLMHHLLDHSLRFLEKYYGIYYHGLRYQFAEICKRALLDPDYEKKLNALIEACNDSILGKTSSKQTTNPININ